MAPYGGQNRAKELKKLYDHGVTARDSEVDPEAEGISGEASESNGSETESDPEEAAREHYIDVGKSKLRKPKESLLGAQYRGSRVGRDKLSDDDDDEPFGRGFEDEGSDEEPMGVDSAARSHEDEGDDDVTPDSDVSDDDDEVARPGIVSQPQSRTTLRDLPVVGASLAKGNEADVQKGNSVKRQRKTFDSLLSTRMKLQKALVGANTVVAIPGGDLASEREDAASAIEAAEVAAFNLWSTLTNFREDMRSARTGDKRKAFYSVKSSTARLWSHQQDQESSELERRNATLQKWSTKTSEGQASSTSKLTASAPQTTVLDVIQQHTADMPRLVARAQTPRSCAPIQAASKTTSIDKNIYDDADFYGLLLKELLEQKSADSATATSNIDFSFQMRREAKTKKNVDTKASKGRKLRFTVHEKLQNFMAPEDRRGWGDRQADELFGSLFGRRMELSEDVVEDDADMGADDNGEVDAEEALMMFRR
ncbi:rRNA-processing protein bfr2 [Recurvomyces mirabilis]|uniref:Protein BFR2 n=1 Tax=Recurvomyces mirabilis TaxID=574656 RepID=A0AAE1C097_9PEZI|nr:rRNA-processing protein bfr2 [Recurvomyces mirabilis]KAK5151925.1 rRNA-processing protein bfr2 [Recurvomyces mirabilis]